MDHLDFEVQVSPGTAGDYRVEVRSEYGDASGTMRFPFDTLALRNRLQALKIAPSLARGSSLRAAQLAIHEAHPDPFYWGGRVTEGASGPISA